MHIASVLGKDTRTKAVAENTPEQLSLSLGPLGDNCWLLSPACPNLLAPNSMVPPSATSSGTAQVLLQSDASLASSWANWLLPGVQPRRVSMVLLQTARGGMGFITHCHTGEAGAQVKEPSGAKILSFEVQGLGDMLWRVQLWKCSCSLQRDWNLTSHHLPSPCFSQGRRKGSCPITTTQPSFLPADPSAPRRVSHHSQPSRRAATQG